MKKTFLLFLAIITFLLLPVSAWSASQDKIHSSQGRLRMTFEELELPGGEGMGFVGGTFLFDLSENLAYGLASYGALTGERGGFITLGFSYEYTKKLVDALSLSSGFFVGAGGGRGGFTLQGGGLMLRPHLGLQINAGLWGNLGLGLSHVRFPNGSVRSSQAYFAYEYPFSTLIASAWREKQKSNGNSNPQLPSAERAFAAVYRTYFVPDGVLTDGGSLQHKTINLMGVEWHYYLDENIFLKLETEGAMGGRSNGYMQIFMGGGYRWWLTRRNQVKIETQLGVAGGGTVATGGGLLADVSLGYQQYVTDRFYLGASGGYVNAPDGDFRATSLSLKLGYDYGVPLVPKGSVKYASLASYAPKHLRLRTTQQSYLKARADWRNHHVNRNVNLLGLQGDYFIRKNVYLSGQGIAAYEGQAGGYMTGLWGVGYHLPLFRSALFLDLEGLVGAAGGGGLDVAGGLVWQTNAGIGLQLSDQFSLIASTGYMSAPKGNFRAKVLGLALAYRFTIFTH